MRILAIDDQILVLLPLQKRLEELGYEVRIETDALRAITHYNSFNPDLVIVDIKMPKISGLDLVKYIRVTKNSQTPIIVLSGDRTDETIIKGFELGINDYMKKPLSLNEISVRIKRLIGATEVKNTIVNSEVVIQGRCVGVVIPCYNEEKRLLCTKFTNYISKNSGYHLCFVNDGSKDRTLKILKKLQKGKEDFITIYNCEKNGGKAEAVRLGMLHLAKKEGLDYIGFLDADLSTNFDDFDDLIKIINHSGYKIVSGSRIARMGANITKKFSREIISLTINFIIRKILSMDFKDTQCGAKAFRKDVIDIAFEKKFVTQWVFDVEIFKRITQHYGLKKAKTMLCELPLKRWIHVDGSKLSLKDSIKIIGQLAQIAWIYRSKKTTIKSFPVGEFNAVPN
jgi:CheY-like chemotaxis protein/glycosyltransferase involved in cell wall biosynthesis